MTQYDIRRIGFPNIGEEVKVITKSDIVVDAIYLGDGFFEEKNKKRKRHSHNWIVNWYRKKGG